MRGMRSSTRGFDEVSLSKASYIRYKTLTASEEGETVVRMGRPWQRRHWTSFRKTFPAVHYLHLYFLLTPLT